MCSDIDSCRLPTLSSPRGARFIPIRTARRPLFFKRDSRNSVVGIRPLKINSSRDESRYSDNDERVVIRLDSLHLAYLVDTPSFYDPRGHILLLKESTTNTNFVDATIRNAILVGGFCITRDAELLSRRSSEHTPKL